MTAQRAPLPGSDDPGPATGVWSSAAWRRRATAWIDESLERRGITRVPITPRQPRLRPWGTSLVVETSQGRTWFKAGLPEQTNEAVVRRVLAGIGPDTVPTTWATDSDTGWLLGPDAGPTLREAETADTVTSALSGVLRRYGRLQRASTRVVGELAARGVPVLTPHDLVAAWSERADVETRRTLVGRLRAAADRVGELDLPPALQHDDLHPGNVFARSAEAADVQEATIFDWGDAYVGHPMLSLLIPLRHPGSLGLAPDTDRDRRLVRAWATGWGAEHTGAMLSALDDALLLARIGRVLGWERALTRATPAERKQWVAHPARWWHEITAVAQAG